MKIKTSKAVLWCTVILFALVRILQCVFVIGQDGYFMEDTLNQLILSRALYVLMAVAVIVSFALRIGSGNKYSVKVENFAGMSLAVCGLIVAVTFAISGVVQLISREAAGVLTVLTATFFTLFVMGLKNTKTPVMKLFSIFALLYPCARLITLFFSTFRMIKASENLLEVVGLCAMIFMFISLTKLTFGFEEPASKTAWSIYVFVAFGTLLGPLKLITVLLGKISIARLCDWTILVSDIVLWLFAISFYISLSKIVPNQNNEESFEKSEEL